MRGAARRLAARIFFASAHSGRRLTSAPSILVESRAAASRWRFSDAHLDICSARMERSIICRFVGGFSERRSATAASAAALTAALTASTVVASHSPRPSAEASAKDDSTPQTAFGENVEVDADTLRDLAVDIRGRPACEDVHGRRRRALRILARVTLFVDYHDAVVAVPEVTDALRWVVGRCGGDGGHVTDGTRGGDTNDGSSVQRDGDVDWAVEDESGVSDEALAVALHCLADLAKTPEVRAALAMDEAALEVIADALSPTFWRRGRKARLRGALNGDDRGGVESDERLRRRRPVAPASTMASTAMADVARLCAELAGDDAIHAALIKACVPSQLAAASRALDGGGSSWPWARLWFNRERRQKDSALACCEGSELIMHERELKRHAACAFYALARSAEGRAAVVAAKGHRTLGEWAQGKHDRVVHRHAVGALARLCAAAVGDDSLSASDKGEVKDAAASNGAHGASLLSRRERREALRSAMTALSSGDGQAACFATAALRQIAVKGDEDAHKDVVKLGAPRLLLELLVRPGDGWAGEQERAEASLRAKKRGEKGRGDMPGHPKQKGEGDGGVDDGAVRGDGVNETTWRVISMQATMGTRACAMRALEDFSTARMTTYGHGVLAAAILRVPGGITLLAEVANGEHGCTAPHLQKQASRLLSALGL